MRKLILTLAIIIITSFGSISYGQGKQLPKPITQSPVEQVKTEVVVAEEDAQVITQAYQIVESKKKDYELSLSNAATVEADAAANAGVTRKTHELARNDEGKLVFRVRPPAPSK